MTNRKIKLGIDWILKKGETVNLVANTFDISPGRIEQFVKIFKETGKYPILNPKRRLKVYLTEDLKKNQRKNIRTLHRFIQRENKE